MKLECGRAHGSNGSLKFWGFWLWWAAAVLLLVITLGASAEAQDVVRSGGGKSASDDTQAELLRSNQELHHRVDRLESEVAELQQLVTRLAANQKGMTSGVQAASITPAPVAIAAQAGSTQEQVAPSSKEAVLTSDDKKVLDFLHDTTINLNLDTYYAYNFNHPYDEVNLLRAYDVLSNNFSLNQADVIFEHAPDVAAGRRWGARLDLQFGQATDALQGNPANEPRPDVYRNVFQAFGTYVIPVGKNGITADFGKWASSLGIEGNYTKDQLNYSRSYLYTFLPSYHMGLRASYPINDKIAVNYWVVNGIDQTEATNAFKDQLVGFVLTPKKSLSWTVNYYYGQDHPDRTPASNCGPVPVQPGLCYAPIRPAPDGRTHIFDSYATWHPTSRWTLAAEGDYFVQRLWRTTAPGESSAPADVIGGAGYVGYEFTKKVAVAGRAEYLSDSGGLFSGIDQALKETTATFDYKFGDGFLMRYEWRRDFSNQPTFLTDMANVLSKQQNTATVGVIWWYGRKEGTW
jgi:hypothetical protein